MQSARARTERASERERLERDRTCESCSALTPTLPLATLAPMPSASTVLGSFVCATRASMRLASFALVSLALACGDSTTPPPGMRDGDVDTTDRDGDGLCNETEGARMTNPDVVDTDGDGWSDLWEILAATDPLDATRPDRAFVATLRENAVADLVVPVEIEVSAAGEDYSGAFEAEAIQDPLGQTAASYFLDAIATFAAPNDNVAFVDTDGEAFRAVVGRTLLGFELRFDFAGERAPCARAYPFRYTVKRSDGILVASRRILLVVLPEGGSLGVTPWCVPASCR